MSPQTPRRPSSSRTSTPRPRKIAGRAAEPVEAPAVAAEETSEPVALDKARGRTERRAKTPAGSAPADADGTSTAAPEEDAGRGGVVRRLALFGEPRLTRTLLITLAVIAVVLAAQGVWFAVHHHRANARAAVPEGEIAVPAGRPIMMNQSDLSQATDQAQKDVVTLMGLRYKTFDEDVAKAVDLTTSDYATKFKQTSADIKQKYLADKIDLSAKVTGEAVVRANTTQVQVLLFVSQFVTKGSGKDRRVTLTPYRVLVTMVHTNTGWLVDGMDTK